MDKIKVSTERLSEPNLQKLARALLSIARRQVAAGTAKDASVTNPPEVTPEAGKDAA